MAFTGEQSLSYTSKYGDTQDIEADVESSLRMVGVRMKAINKLTSHGIGAVEKSVAVAQEYLSILEYSPGGLRIGQLATLDPHKFLCFNPVLLSLALHYWGKRPSTMAFSTWKDGCIRKLVAAGKHSVTEVADIDIVRYILLCDTNRPTSPFDYY